MLCEFDFLGEEKAYEIVVKNTNIINDMIESLIPVPNNVLYTPKIENCEQMLTDMCFNKGQISKGTLNKIKGIFKWTI